MRYLRPPGTGSPGTRRSTRWRTSTGLPFAPKTLNVKPSRFGSVRRLFAGYDYCAEHGIAVYGGGQWELGPGRGRIQHLASLFHPTTPNDVAPAAFNIHRNDPPPGLPTSPLEPHPSSTGFRWGRPLEA